MLSLSLWRLSAQLLNLIDPLIFGKIIDDYALNPLNLAEEALVAGVLFWLGIAIGIALLSRLAKAFQDYFTRLAVQKFGMQIFNDGLKQTLRLSYHEFEDQRSGETLSILQKVRTDTQIFINTTINVLFSSIIGIGFLIVYAVTKELAADTGFFDWDCCPGITNWPVKQEDQDDAAGHQSRDEQNVGGDHGIPPEH